jgi:hypothetical protein
VRSLGHSAAATSTQTKTSTPPNHNEPIRIGSNHCFFEIIDNGLAVDLVHTQEREGTGGRPRASGSGKSAQREKEISVNGATANSMRLT